MNIQKTSIFDKTVLASCGASLWRINLMPLDTLKTTLQVEGKKEFLFLKINLY